MKSGISGVHQWVSVKHLSAYVDEFATRLSISKGDTINFVADIAKRMFDRQLSYKQLKARGQASALALWYESCISNELRLEWLGYT